jgi:hypothetical protein
VQRILLRKPKEIAMLRAPTKEKKPSRKAAPRKSNPTKVIQARKISHIKPQSAIDTAPKSHATKRDQILKLLRSGEGATLQEIVTATNWQAHSARGFLAGVVRKKLGLNLISAKADRGRIYRIDDRPAGAPETKVSKRRA